MAAAWPLQEPAASVFRVGLWHDPRTPSSASTLRPRPHWTDGGSRTDGGSHASLVCAAAAALVLGKPLCRRWHAAPCPLLRLETVLRARRFSFSDFSNLELRTALGTFGVHEVPERLSKRDLAEWIFSLRLPAYQLAQALREARGKCSRNRQSSHGPRRRKNDHVVDSVPAHKLRTVMKMMGVNHSGSKREIMEAMHEMGVMPQDVGHILNDAAFFQRKKNNKNKHGRRQSRSKSNSAESSAASAPRRGRRRDSSAAKERRRRRELEEEDTFFDSGFGQDTFFDSGPDDFFEYVQDQMPWDDIDSTDEKVSDRTSRSHSGFRSYHAFQEEQRAQMEDERWVWQQVTGARGSPQPRSSPRQTPEEAMATALREQWVPERISRGQAALLLGVPPCPSSQELLRAKKQGILRWHPDRNQSDPSTGDAFRLVMAASDLLSSS